MKLSINTIEAESMLIELSDNDKVIFSKREAVHRNQSEKLLPAIDELLKSHDLTLSDISKIEVKNGEGSFSCLRIGIVTANALAYALGVPVVDDKGKKIEVDDLCLVKPEYNGEANITKPKNK